MKNRSVLSLHLSLSGALVLAFTVGSSSAQQALPSPTPAEVKEQEQEKSTTTAKAATGDEQTSDGYNITSSIEVGVRGKRVSGSDNKFQSDLNYRPGVRVFDSSFLLQQKDHRGQFFDELLVNSSGWGGDPQGSTRVNIEKASIYRFDAKVRRFKYFNNLANLALGQHTADTRLQFGDYDLVLLPKNDRLKFSLGFSRDSQRGPAVTTYTFSRDDFAIDSRQEQRANNFRAGADARLGPIDLSFLQGARYFSDDSSYSVTSRNVGNNPANTSVISSLFRELPTKGRLFFTRFSAHTLIARKLDVTGRYIYSSSTTNFSLFEQVRGRSGAAGGNIINPEISTASGEVKRPFYLGDIGVTLMATDRLRISNAFRVDNFRISGGDALTDSLSQFNFTTGAGLPPTTTLASFQHGTKYLRFVNTIEGDYQLNKSYAFHVGYRLSDRHIELFSRDASDPEQTEKFDNRAHSLIFGLKARPIPAWTIYFDGEHGSSDNTFTRLENGKYTNFRMRNRIVVSNELTLNASFVTRNNDNPSEALEGSSLLPPGSAPNSFDAQVKSRLFTSSVDWTPKAKFSFSGGYTHQRLTSDTGIIVFIAGRRTLGQSLYFMKNDFFFFNMFVNPLPRVTLFASYRLDRDPGQGNGVSPAANVIVGSYPMSFQAPEARITYRLTQRVEWNLGYQYYNYRDRFVPVQNYRAHLPYTSLRYYFGRKG